MLALLRGRAETWEETGAQLLTPPAWMMLKWTCQLLALLNEPHGECVAPLLERLAAAYPAAVYHPFQLSKESVSRKPRLAPRVAATVRAMSAVLHSPRLEALAAAFEDLTHPELRYKDLLETLTDLLKEGRVEEARASYVELTRWLRDPKRGGFLADFAKAKVGSQGERTLQKLDGLCGVDGQHLGRFVGSGGGPPTLQRELNRVGMGWRKLEEVSQVWVKGNKQRSTRLESYSPLLAKYHRADEAGGDPLEALELPGQYDGDAPPLVDQHAAADSFDAELLVMASLRKPKRLTVYCSDQRERRYLIKGGEDLRQDQRIQQIFAVVNTVLAADGQCATRGLAMRTYSVLPLNERVGFIEWMDGTQPLGKLIEKVARVKHRGGQDPISMAATKFAAAYPSASKGQLPRWASCSRRDAEQHLADAHALLPADLLSRGIESLSVGARSHTRCRNLNLPHVDIHARLASPPPPPPPTPPTPPPTTPLLLPPLQEPSRSSRPAPALRAPSPW